MKYLLIIIISYLLGSIPFSYLIGKKIYGIDIRTKGSKNPGTTNAFRSFGKKAGILTLILDLAKGIFAVYLGYLIAGFNGELIALLVTPFGHIFSFFLKFKGGKGVATTAGALIAVDYRVVIVLLIIFLLVFLIFRIVSLASICCAVLSNFVVIYFYGISLFSFVMLGLSLLVIYMHRENIKRLINGSEKKMF